MTCTIVAVVTDVVRDGTRVIGYGFNSNGRYGQGAMMRERFIPRIMDTPPRQLESANGDNLDPSAVCRRSPNDHGWRVSLFRTCLL
jgi:hypothetical protein